MQFADFLEADVLRRERRRLFLWGVALSLLALLASYASFLFWQRPNLERIHAISGIGFGVLIYLLLLRHAVRLFLLRVEPSRATAPGMSGLPIISRFISASGLSWSLVGVQVASLAGYIIAGCSLAFFTSISSGPSVLLLALITVLLFIPPVVMILPHLVPKQWMEGQFSGVIVGAIAYHTDLKAKDARKEPYIKALMADARRVGLRGGWAGFRKYGARIHLQGRIMTWLFSTALVQALLVAAIAASVAIIDAEARGPADSFGVSAFILGSAAALALLQILAYLLMDNTSGLIEQLRIALLYDVIRDAEAKRAYMTADVLRDANLFRRWDIHGLIAMFDIAQQRQLAIGSSEPGEETVSHS